MDKFPEEVHQGDFDPVVGEEDVRHSIVRGLVTEHCFDRLLAPLLLGLAVLAVRGRTKRSVGWSPWDLAVRLTPLTYSDLGGTEGLDPLTPSLRTRGMGVA